MRLLVFLLVVSVCLANQKRTYHGYQVLRTSKLEKSQADVLRELQFKNVVLDFWKEAQPGKSAEIMAGPDALDSLKTLLGESGIEYTVKIQDVESLIQSNEAANANPVANPKIPINPKYDHNWIAYHSHSNINEFLDELAATYDFVSTVTIGQTYEGRDMKVIQIGNGGPNIPTVWVEAGIHAREWISPAVATFLIRELVENYAAHPQYVDQVQVHVLPSTNPDGYAYSRNSERLWRKTRSETGSALGCLGVDSNRNYDYHWGESGVSMDKCADTYPGDGPFSEIENQNVRDYVLSISPTPTLANAIHSAAELWLFPYGYAFDTFPPNVDEMQALGDDAVQAIFDTHGIQFICEHSAELYPAAGDSNDWYTGVVGARFAYTTELRDQGFGFVLPPDQIIPSGEEMWAAYEVLLDKVIEVSKKQ